MKHLFFDLDGTLTHSHVGIIRCINHSLNDAGVGVRSDTELRRFLGPPLRERFATLIGTADAARVERAMPAYRDRFETVGMFENAVCPCIPETLVPLKSAGCDLHVVTAKPAVSAPLMLEHFDLDGCFAGVYGPELGSRGYSQTSLIGQALRAVGFAADSSAMIGDRGEDIMGARANQVYAVAVTWGYGDLEELEAAAPDLIVNSPAQLLTVARFQDPDDNTLSLTEVP